MNQIVLNIIYIDKLLEKNSVNPFKIRMIIFFL